MISNNYKNDIKIHYESLTSLTIFKYFFRTFSFDNRYYILQIFRIQLTDKNHIYKYHTMFLSTSVRSSIPYILITTEPIRMCNYGPVMVRRYFPVEIGQPM